jgi:type II secretory pathway pseudopilin PulG
MNLTRQNADRARSEQAFTMVEALFAMALSGIMFLALYSGLASGLTTVKMARENTRATQILLEHMEIVRLYRWEQVTNIGVFMPTNKFVVPYYKDGNTNSSLSYTCQVRVAACPLGTAYADDMRKVTVQVDWSPMGQSYRTRSMSTYVTRSGLQNYVW